MHIFTVTSENAATTSLNTGSDCEIFNKSKLRSYLRMFNFNDNDIISHVEPEMFDLTKIVIPKIMNKWEYIAEALRYDLATIDAIKDKERDDPKRCCRVFFKDWLTTNNGAKAGPKVWSTLLDTLKQVDEISADTTEDIIEKVKQL